MNKLFSKNPLTPHLQIYKWQISSLLSITNRIIGVINFISIILICFWLISLRLDANNYFLIFNLMNSVVGKFLIIFLCWAFSFQILNEIRHLAWDLGYGYDTKVAKITGILVFAGSFILAILIYLVGNNLVN